MRYGAFSLSSRRILEAAMLLHSLRPESARMLTRASWYVYGLCTDNPARSIWILYLKESKRGGAKQSKATQRSAKKRKATLPNKDFRISHTHNG